MGVFDFLRKSTPVGIDRVVLRDDGATHFKADGAEERIVWDDLHAVHIRTTDQGPLQDDVFFLLIDSSGRSVCTIPQTSEGIHGLLDRLQQLLGFDNEALINAMTSTSNNTLVCWKRSPGS